MQRKHLFWFAPLCTFALLASIFWMMPHNAMPAESTGARALAGSEAAVSRAEAPAEYILQSEGDRLVLRKSADGAVVQYYDIRPSLLPEADRQLLANGIATGGGSALQQLLEDYGG